LGYGQLTLFISFSRSLEFVIDWGSQWIYLARVHHAVDIEQHLGSKDQRELMAYAHVFWDDIYGFRQSPRYAQDDEGSHYYLNPDFNDGEVSGDTLLKARNLMKCGHADLIDPDVFDRIPGTNDDESESESDSGYDSGWDQEQWT